MGRQRIKSCDPFYKGPRKNPVRKGNLPPQNNEDQPAPKSLLRLLKFGGQVTSRKKAVSQNNQTVVPSQKAPHKIVKSSKTDHKCEPESSVTSETREASPPVPPQGRAAMFVRRPGESTRNYLERIDVESKFRIADCLRKERKKSNKRKIYLEERKKKLKSRKQHKVDSFKDFSDFKDNVRFNEVVQAPPQLSAKPRGSSKKPKMVQTLDISGVTTSESAGHQGLKHQQDIEDERTRVIEEYRLSKKLKLSLTKDRTTKSLHQV